MFVCNVDILVTLQYSVQCLFMWIGKFEFLNNILCNKCFCSIFSWGRDSLSWPLVLTFIWCIWRGMDPLLFSKGAGLRPILTSGTGHSWWRQALAVFEPSTKLTGFETWPHTLKPTPRWHVPGLPLRVCLSSLMYCHYVEMASLEANKTQQLIVSVVGAAGVFGP